ncbi:signal peptidase I [Candidatus Kuenenbacteria bacterium CG1_02_38_13]|uniref:Signal peptidase I n=1 Tax=Candidatus Kuenenbacteria bacterium CG1_02_38_13 TaxID=1805235 RepID=A0A1J4U6I9_9BACT|nr:MAG: signal peptidase I [Candidatus Kuenenbacteria bacterium CG1_02_38_13]
MKSPIKFVFELISWLFIGIIVLLVFFTVGSNTNILRGYKSFMVLSGSMEPTINIGDIVITHKQINYFKNDTITFYGPENRVVTHRIALIKEQDGDTIIITKGDANRSIDSNTITPSKIIGKVIFIVPKLGFVVSFSRTIPGLVLLIFVPAVALISSELLKLKNA